MTANVEKNSVSVFLSDLPIVSFAFDDFFEAELYDHDTDIEDSLSEAVLVHQSHKESRRYNRFKHRTSARERKGTLHAMRLNHSCDVYNRMCRDERKRADDSRAMRHWLESLDFDKSTVSEDTPHKIDWICDNPWNNLDMVLKSYDKCTAAYIRRNHPKLGVVYGFETLRSQIELGNISISYNEGRTENLKNYLECFELLVSESVHDLLLDPVHRQIMRDTIKELCI